MIYNSVIIILCVLYRESLQMPEERKQLVREAAKDSAIYEKLAAALGECKPYFFLICADFSETVGP